MTEASKKRMEELFSKWWFVVGGSIHGIWKRRQWSSLKEFAKNVPRMGYQEGYQAGTQDPDANLEKIKKFGTDIAHLKLFGNCEFCEPVYGCCQSATGCGCYGYPTDFKSTEKCLEGCSIRLTSENKRLREALTSISQGLGYFIRENSKEKIDYWKFHNGDLSQHWEESILALTNRMYEQKEKADKALTKWREFVGESNG